MLNWSNFLPRLARYLTADSFNSLQSLSDNFEQADNSVQAGIARKLQTVIRSLESLRHVLVNYAPRCLAELDPVPGEPRGEVMQGSFLFADMTGFTALTELMASRDYARGQEAMNRIMNRFFAEILDPLITSSGDLLIFAGDAVLAFFPKQENDNDVLQAARAALRMQRAIAPFTSFETEFGPASLAMTVGIERGPAYIGIVGTEHRMEMLVSGPGIFKAIHAEEQGKPGQVTLGTQAMTIAGNHFTMDGPLVIDDLDDALGDYEISLPKHRSSGLTLFSLDTAEILQTLDIVLQRVERLAPFLPEDMLARLINTNRLRQLPPELRPVAVQFINILGLEDIVTAHGPEKATAVFQQFFVRVQEIVTRHEGVISQIDAYTKGFFFLNTFGTPKAHEGTKHYAVSAALHTARALEQVNHEFNLDPPLQQRGGITYGLIFTGEVGTKYRRESVVIGTAVNRAARLMSKAEPGQVILDADIWEDIKGAFAGEQLPAVTLKGIDGPVVIANVRQVRLGVRLQPLERPLAGRGTEQSDLLKAVEMLAAQKGSAWFISGETGLGKTALVRYLAEIAKKHNLLVLAGTSQPHGRHISLFTWMDLLTGWLNTDMTGSFDEARNQLAAELAGFGLSRFEPALAELLLHSADDKETPIAVPNLITAVLAGLAQRQPVILILEDIHWIDSESQSLLNKLLSEYSAMPVMFVLTGRNPEGYSNNIVQLALSPLAPEHIIQVARYALGAESLSRSLARWITEQSAGNPLFARELCHALQQADSIILNKGTGKAYWTKEEPNLPLSLHELFLARIDELPLPCQDVLKQGAVLGLTFKYDELLHLSGKQMHEHEIRKALDTIVNVSFLTAVDKNTYQFNHPLMQEAVYETLSFLQRRAWHTSIGNFLEGVRPQRDQTLLLAAYHYLRGTDVKKAANFGRRAGDRTKKHREYTSAMEYYEQVLNLQDAPAREKALAAESLADVIAIRGDYASAVQAYARAVELGSAGAAGKHAILSGDIDRLGEIEFSAVLRHWAEGAQAWIMTGKGEQKSALDLARKASASADGQVRTSLEGLVRTLETGESPGDYEEWLGQFANIVLQGGFSPVDLLDMPERMATLMQKIIRSNGITPTEAAKESGRSLEETQQDLDELVRKGYARKVRAKEKTLYKAVFGRKPVKKVSSKLWSVLD